MSERTLHELFLARAGEMGLAATEEQARKLCAFQDMLAAVNREMNLTRIPEEDLEIVDRNWLDSLTPVALGAMEGARTIADVGSGAGFPGIPLSILLPQARVTLIDSLEKRVRFLRAVIEELGLNAEALHLRAEEAGRRPDLRESFDRVTARAVARLDTLSELCLPLARVGGRFIAYKGPSAVEELTEARPALKVLGGGNVRLRSADIPGRDWSHCLIEVEKHTPTPAQYPRRPGVPGKKPISAPVK